MTAIRQYLTLWRAALSDSFPERYAARFLLLFVHAMVCLALWELLMLASALLPAAA